MVVCLFLARRNLLNGGKALVNLERDTAKLIDGTTKQPHMITFWMSRSRIGLIPNERRRRSVRVRTRPLRGGGTLSAHSVRCLARACTHRGKREGEGTHIQQRPMQLFARALRSSYRRSMYTNTRHRMFTAYASVYYTHYMVLLLTFLVISFVKILDGRIALQLSIY